MSPNYLLTAINCKKSLSHTNNNFNRKKVGAYIVKWYQKYKKLDYSLTHMYVIKKDIGIYTRGQQVFEKPDVPYRDIYFYPKETRVALRELLPVFDRPARNQIGFTTGKGIQDLMQTEPERSDLTRVKLDLKDAFNSIRREQIFWLLHETFDVNKTVANELSHLWTTKGHMLQGHPLAPAIFNLITRDLNEWLSKRTGIIQYADDILIFEESKYISWKWLKTIFRKFKSLGFKMNVEKEGFYHNKEDLEFLGLRFTYDNEKPLESAKRRKRRKKIRKLRSELGDDSKILKGNIIWYEFDAKQIVLSKMLLENDFTKQEVLKQKRNKIKKKRKKTSEKKDLWKLFANPASFECHYTKI